MIKKTNKIAVIGAGFAGMAVATLLAERGFPVDIYDTNPIGEGTSGIAAGLVYPFAGKRSKLNREGFEGLEASKRLFALSSSAIGKSVILSKGLYRPVLTEEQKSDFKACATRYPDDVIWMEYDAVSKLYPGMTPTSGIYIYPAFTIDCKQYLKGLWLYCHHRGVTFNQKKMDIDAVSGHYNTVFICTGAHFSKPGFSLTPVRGQILTLTWPAECKPLPSTVNSYKYLSMDISGTCCHAGATFERDFKNLEPDIEFARNDIIPHLSGLFPHLKESNVIDCKSGIRASTPDKMPVIRQYGDNVWVFTGLGSKGLLYHALYAEKLVKKAE